MTSAAHHRSPAQSIPSARVVESRPETRARDIPAGEHTPAQEMGEHARRTGVPSQDRSADGLACQHGDNPIRQERLQQRAQKPAYHCFDHVVLTHLFSLPTQYYLSTFSRPVL